jgi:feruloyl esterase
VNVGDLLCRGKNSPDCLTAAQAATLDLIQSGRTDAGARRRYYGFAPIAAAIPNNWDQWILNPDRGAPSELAFATQAFRYLILDQPDWQVERFDVARDFERASNRTIAGRRLSQILDADDPDLTRFERRGGKLILYVGSADAVISPAAALAFYRKIERLFGGATRRFARLFVVPGMQHCQGGLAPNAFGQAWVAPALRSDTDHDIRLALEAWVEQGRAPRSLIAVKFEGDRRGGALVATQRLWPYPALADAIRNVRP